MTATPTPTDLPEALRLSDEDCTRIYKQANGEDVGKAQPLTTARIFRAMRAAAPSAAPAVAPQAGAESYEHQHAVMEAHRNAKAEEYFKARHEMLDTIAHRRIFEAGFGRGWDERATAALSARGAQPQAGAESTRPGVQIPCGPKRAIYGGYPEPALRIAGAGYYNVYQMEPFADATAALRARGAVPSDAECRAALPGEQDARDAARYRTWRDNMIADTGMAFHKVVAQALPAGVGAFRRPTAPEWDAAIDAAMAAAPQAPAGE